MATITYNANGGYYPPASQTFTGHTTITSSKPSRTGYDFLGWATTSYATAATYLPGSSYSGGSVTLYAVWKIKTFTIRYNPNGGSGGPVSQAKTWGDQNFYLSTSEPTRSGREFLGWSTSSSASVPMYKPGDKFTGNYDVLLYAVWDSFLNETPGIQGLMIDRCTSSGTLSDSGKYARIYGGYWSAVAPCTISIKYSTSSAGPWTNARTVSNSTNAGTLNEVIGGSFSVDTVYYILIEITDGEGREGTAIGTLSTQTYVIDFHAGGDGVAFGGASTMGGFEVVDWPARFGGNIIANGNIVASGQSDFYGDTWFFGDVVDATDVRYISLPGDIRLNRSSFIKSQPSYSSRGMFVDSVGIANGSYLQLQNTSDAFHNFIGMNDSNQFEMYWTSNYPIMGDMGKTLFSGAWSPASSATANSTRTIANASKYRVFLIMIDTSGTYDYGNTAWAVAVRGDVTVSSYRIAGGVFMPNSNPTYSDMYFRSVFITASGNTWNLRTCGQMGFGPATPTPNWTKMYVRKIVGLI